MNRKGSGLDATSNRRTAPRYLRPRGDYPACDSKFGHRPVIQDTFIRTTIADVANFYATDKCIYDIAVSGRHRYSRVHGAGADSFVQVRPIFKIIKVRVVAQSCLHLSEPSMFGVWYSCECWDCCDLYGTSHCHLRGIPFKATAQWPAETAEQAMSVAEGRL
jgi:hypothetical protein